METITTHTFLVPKRDYSPEECQDSIYPLPGKSSSAFFAVADGATTTFHSGRWAQELTRHFSEHGNEAFADWDAWIEHPRKDWLESARKLAEKGDANLFIKNKFAAREAASATFVGLNLGQRTAEGIAWRALVLGDSCIFHVAEEGKFALYTSLTKENFSSNDFGYITFSACSYPTAQPDLPTLFRSVSKDGGQCPPGHDGDFFILATDALSKWLIMRHEKDIPVWGTLLALTKAEEFTSFIEQIREDDPRLDDDDVALAVICIGKPHACYSDYLYEPPAIEKPAPVAANGKVDEKPESKLEGLMKSRQAPPAAEAKPEEPKTEPAAPEKPPTIWEKVDDVVNSAVFQRRAAFALMALGFIGVDMMLAFWWGSPAPLAPIPADTIPALVETAPTPAPTGKPAPVKDQKPPPPSEEKETVLLE